MPRNQEKNHTPPTNYFPMLDGARGIAAAMVVILHTSHLWGFRPPHAYLAVDLFFLMSGIVIAQAYSEKLTHHEISAAQFMKLRVARLYPAYLLSIALAVIIIAIGIPPPDLRGADFGTIAASSMLALVFLPFKISATAPLFALNPAYWSLAQELLQNAIFSITPKKCKKYLPQAALLFGAIIAAGASTKGDMDFGSTWKPSSIIGGFCRSGFGFLLGVAIQSRLPSISEKIPAKLKTRTASWAALLTCATLIATPDLGAKNFLMDILIVLLGFPILTIIMTQTRDATQGPGAVTLKLLGASSYPAYVIHIPLSIAFTYIANLTQTRPSIVTGGLFLLSTFAFSLAIENLYERRSIRWLKKFFR